MVWLSSPEAVFLRGKFVWANWDVEELVAIGSQLHEGSEISVDVEAWPLVLQL